MIGNVHDVFNCIKKEHLCFLCLLMLWFGSIHAHTMTRDHVSDISHIRNDLVICVTIPKSGTHLLVKCLALLDIDRITYDYKEEDRVGNGGFSKYHTVTLSEFGGVQFNKLLQRIKLNCHKKRSYLVHLSYEEKYTSFFQDNVALKFLMIRDPRDQLVSAAATALHDSAVRDSQEMESILLELLLGLQTEVPRSGSHFACDVIWTNGIVNFHRSFLRWADEPNFCVIRFENLVGPEGGGSLEAQFEEIRKIGEHLGVALSDDKIWEVRDNLYGGTKTFKEGQSRSWEYYFTPRVKDAFKNTPGACQLLIDMGYEQDCNW